jgi:hypothetical protein
MHGNAIRFERCCYPRDAGIVRGRGELAAEGLIDVGGGVADHGSLLVDRLLYLQLQTP